jgi:hypothetical protein
MNFKGRVVRKNKLLSFFEYGFELYEITDGNRRNLIHFIISSILGADIHK